MSFASTAALSSEKLLHHTCLQSILKLHCKVDYLQQLFGREAGACLFFLKSEQMQVPPPCLGSPCVRSSPSLFILLLQPFLPFLKGVKEQDTSNT